MMIVLPNRHYNGHQMATEKQGDQRTPVNEILKRLEERYRQKKMEAAAENRAVWRQVVCGLCSTGSDNALVK